MLNLGVIIGLIKGFINPIKSGIQGLGLTVNNSGELCVSFEQEDDEE